MRAAHLLEGRLGERVACRYLMRRGYDVIARRWRARFGEIDIAAFEGDVLVFVEVKTRSNRDYGEPFEFVDWQKRQKLRQAADEFIAEHDLGSYAWRFDIVSVVAPGKPCEEITLFRDAF